MFRPSATGLFFFGLKLLFCCDIHSVDSLLDIGYLLLDLEEEILVGVEEEVYVDPSSKLHDHLIVLYPALFHNPSIVSRVCLQMRHAASLRSLRCTSHVQSSFSNIPSNRLTNLDGTNVLLASERVFIVHS